MEMPGLVKEQVAFTWMIYSALEMRADCWTAGSTPIITASIMKMQELSAMQHVGVNCDRPCILCICKLGNAQH